jgi:hypothetical protein
MTNGGVACAFIKQLLLIACRIICVSLLRKTSSSRRCSLWSTPNRSSSAGGEEGTAGIISVFTRSFFKPRAKIDLCNPHSYLLPGNNIWSKGEAPTPQFTSRPVSLANFYKIGQELVEEIAVPIQSFPNYQRYGIIRTR